MFFLPYADPAARADRVILILRLFGAEDAVCAHAERGFSAPDARSENIHHGHSLAISRLAASAEEQSLSGAPVLHPALAANASCLEEALCVIAAAVRDVVPYEEAAPDWRRPFLSTLPQDGSFRAAEACVEERSPSAPEGPGLPLAGGIELRVSGSRHWITDAAGEALCGPGRTALRITPPEHRGRGYGAAHCAAERLLNIGDSRAHPALTIGGYKSRSRAWDIAAEEARALGLAVADKGPVPDFADLEAVLGEDGDFTP